MFSNLSLKKEKQKEKVGVLVCKPSNNNPRKIFHASMNPFLSSSIYLKSFRSISPLGFFSPFVFFSVFLFVLCVCHQGTATSPVIQYDCDLCTHQSVRLRPTSPLFDDNCLWRPHYPNLAIIMLLFQDFVVFL